MNEAAAPQKEKRHKARNGTGSIYKRGDVYHIAYTSNGRRERESTHSTLEREAIRLLKQRITEHSTTGFTATSDKKVTVGELLDDLLRQYERQGAKSLDNWAIYAVKPLREFLGHFKAPSVNSNSVEAYTTHRLSGGLSNGTVNGELALLRRAFHLAKKRNPPKVQTVPFIKLLPAPAPRRGFFEDADFQRLLPELPEGVRGVVTFAYYTGCRKAEILGLRWEQVDLGGGVVRLYAGETKSGEGRVIPLAPELLSCVTDLKAKRDEFWPQCPKVFTRYGGAPILDFYAAWVSACKRAGKPGALLHDLRRTGVRNLIRAGVSQTVAMKISGHKTDSVFRRYDVTSEEDLKDAAAALGKYVAGKREVGE